jgi:NAD(P)H dehydrogenase (quinone)
LGPASHCESPTICSRRVSRAAAALREITGRDAEDFETIARRHAALPESRHSFGARLAVLARFMAVPIPPGFNPAIYDRAQEQPVPPTPHLALDDAASKARHGIEARCKVS